MKVLTNFLTSLIIAFWLVLIGVISVQNYTLITLNFLWFQSISLPVGILIGLSIGCGLIIGSFLPIFLTKTKGKNKKYIPRQPEPNYNIKYTEENDPLENWEDFEPENW